MSGTPLTGPVVLETAPQRLVAGRLPAARLAAFSALAMPIAAAQLPLLVYLPTLLAQQYGIALTTLGLIFLIEKLWGAAADPLIGVLADRTKARFGRRRWITAGGALFAAAIILLFFPVLPVTPVLLCAELFLLFLAWSMIQIPYFAWSAEVSLEYDERTRVATWQLVATAVALLLILGAAAAVEHAYPQAPGLKLYTLGGTLLAMTAIALPLTIYAFPERPAVAVVPAPRPSWHQAFSLIWAEPLLLRVLASDFSVFIGQSIRGSLFIFFMGSCMGLGKWASLLFLTQFVFGLLAGPIWLRVGYRLGKHRAAVVAELLQAAINFSLLFLRPGDVVPLLVLTVAQGLSQGSGNLMLRAMVADVADKHRLETGHDRTALFFSVFSISMKAGMAVAVGIALPLAAWFGFNPKAAVNTPAALHGLQLLFALGPALTHIISAAFIANFPLDAKAHAAIRRQLETVALEAAGLD